MQIRHQIVRTIYKHSSIGFSVYTLGFKRVCRSFYQGLVSRVQDLGRLVDFFIRVQCIGLRIQKDLQIFIYLLGLGVQEILVSFKKKKKNSLRFSVQGLYYFFPKFSVQDGLLWVFFFYFLFFYHCFKNGPDGSIGNQAPVRSNKISKIGMNQKPGYKPIL